MFSIVNGSLIIHSNHKIPQTKIISRSMSAFIQLVFHLIKLVFSCWICFIIAVYNCCYHCCYHCCCCCCSRTSVTEVTSLCNPYFGEKDTWFFRLRRIYIKEVMIKTCRNLPKNKNFMYTSRWFLDRGLSTSMCLEQQK